MRRRLPPRPHAPAAILGNVPNTPQWPHRDGLVPGLSCPLFHRTGHIFFPARHTACRVGSTEGEGFGKLAPGFLAGRGRHRARELRFPPQPPPPPQPPFLTVFSGARAHVREPRARAEGRGRVGGSGRGAAALSRGVGPATVVGAAHSPPQPTDPEGAPRWLGGRRPLSVLCPSGHGTSLWCRGSPTPHQQPFSPQRLPRANGAPTPTPLPPFYSFITKWL